MEQQPLDLSRVFELEPHGPDTYVGESPPYPWGRIYGGLVVAQALWAAMQTVEVEHHLHSLHSYFILGGDLREPVRLRHLARAGLIVARGAVDQQHTRR